MKRYLLGVDNGGTKIKASIYDYHGREIATVGEKVSLQINNAGFVERDMELLWEKNCQVIRSVLEKSQIDVASIVGLAITGHGNGLYPLDNEGKPVGMGIFSSDTRAQDIVDRWYADGRVEEVSKISCQDVWPGQPVAILSWLRQFDSSMYERIAWILMCKDYVRYRLTGEILAERTDYSGTNLVDPHTGEYSDRLLELFGLSDCRDKLPPLKDSTDQCGSVTKQGAEETGLKAGLPVFGGMFDIDANAIGMGITKPEMLCVIAGTWSVNQCVSASPIFAEPSYRCTNYCMPERWLITESSPTSAGNLEWFITNVLSDKNSDLSRYGYCDELVEHLDPASSALIFLPFLFGSNVKHLSSGGFIGLRGWHSIAHMTMALYEGVVCSHRMHLERILTHFPDMDCCRISGGVVRSRIWVQLFADILNRPMEILENEEIGTLGAAMAAAVGVGIFNSFGDAARSMVRVKERVMPRAHLTSVYNRKYSEYCRVIETLHDL